MARYYVIGEDGNRYGPADEALLEMWAKEGRITPHSFLEEEASGARVVASSMARLVFPPVTTPYMGSPAMPSYGSRYGQVYRQASWGSWEVQVAWGLSILALLLCGSGMPFAVLGLAFAVLGLLRGHRAGGPVALSLFVIALHLVMGRIPL